MEQRERTTKMRMLEEVIEAVRQPDEAASGRMQERLAGLTKPRGSLGRLEEIAQWAAGAKGEVDVSATRKAVFIFAGDHGIARAGVSAYPQEVTLQMVENFLRGGAAINVLARCVNARVVVADVGMCGSVSPRTGLVVRKLARGTRDISREAAMPAPHARAIVDIGLQLFEEYYEENECDIICLGDMGIGNTSAASAVIAAVTGLPVAAVAGRGTGIGEKVWLHKVGLIERALSLRRLHPERPLEILARVGGYEMGAMVGCMLAAASRLTPIILDGIVSTTAALLAVQLCPAVRGYLLSSHLSVERGHRVALDHLGLVPLLNLDMRLGEGTGAVLAAFLTEAACRCAAEMATFEEAGVSGRSCEE